jgi:hypothetical protein
MPESLKKKDREHRGGERYYCPPFFSANISGEDRIEERAAIEDLNLRGLKVRTVSNFEKGTNVRITLVSNYMAPIKIHGRVKWTLLPEDEGASHVVGFSITKVRIVDWFRFLKVIGQIKKEVW